MIALVKPLVFAFRLPRLRLVSLDRRRRRATIDLFHASPHLLRDIGISEDHLPVRHR